ncbi:MAG: hypothetical protein DCC58_00025 [Chloroflexi bacterium]|nr:MAG: hypothetical protein DCC58_00025 [Chloroflexota bacterium]
MPEPLRVPEFTREVAQEAALVAEALPYRMERGIDPERIVWVDVAGRERIGIAWVAGGEIGPHWMLALANADRSKVTRNRVREVIRLVTGKAAPFELAPPFDGAPHMTMVRVPQIS